MTLDGNPYIWHLQCHCECVTCHTVNDLTRQWDWETIAKCRYVWTWRSPAVARPHCECDWQQHWVSEWQLSSAHHRLTDSRPCVAECSLLLQVQAYADVKWVNSVILFLNYPLAKKLIPVVFYDVTNQRFYSSVDSTHRLVLTQQLKAHRSRVIIQN